MNEETPARFTGRTYHHADFDVVSLLRAKEAGGTTISVIIPARNEEGTVGHVAATLRRSLMDRVGLVDEILVVDGDSEDATGEEARAAGVRVVRQSDVLPEAGTGLGKGEALWKGLAASTGDVVACVDADILDIDDRFVIGLVGPLLTNDDLVFTKAAYDRPFDTGTELLAAGGGRVTELMARPLITTFWPDLAWLSQPLSGEYAGRRVHLEQLPFVRGYGVELAMLVDILDRWGPASIAQVDLDRRVHEHQPLQALGRMATEILHVALSRLGAEGRLVLTDEVGALLRQPIRSDGDLDIVETAVAVSERPPLATWRETAQGPVDAADTSKVD